MDRNKKKILIICFSFPPFPGIGGRRWAKFAKHLAQNGFSVNVLAAKNNSGQISEWTNDVKHANIKLNTFSLGLSEVLSVYPKTFSGKLIYRFLSVIGSLLIKGNKQDKIFFIKNKVIAQAEKIIEENKIDTVIVTIPPYKLAYYLLPLKKKFSHLKFMVDYRDPWTDNRSYHGFANINRSDLEKEIEFEKEVLQTADVILDVNAQSLDVLKNKTQSKAKFIHLPNGYDKEDYTSVIPKTTEAAVKRFIYSGSFYPNLIYLLQPLIDCLNKLSKTHSDLYKSLRFDFYGNMDHNAAVLLKQSGCSAITFHGNLPQKQVLDKINGADFCLLFSAADHQHAFNTKFYEYLYFKKPIIYFGNPGEVSSFIENNKVGLQFSPGNISNELYDFLISGNCKNFNYNKDPDINNFDIQNISQKLISIINE